LTQAIPARPADAPGGHAFAQAISTLTDDERESRIRRELLAGNIPKFLRTLVPVRLRSPATTGAKVDVIICAAPDYLAIGSADALGDGTIDGCGFRLDAADAADG
jgi:hypothetical protein